MLVEKPMALTAAECDAMIAAAEEGGAVLAVGLMRRFLRSTRFVRHAVQTGLLGRIRRFDVREGIVYNWPVASDFFFRKETAGGGVLIDTGAHTLDSLLWWLGDVRSLDYFDDNYGGVEADCLLQLQMESGATGVVELSRTRKLRNTAIIEGDRASIEVDWWRIRLTPRETGTHARRAGPVGGRTWCGHRGFPRRHGGFVQRLGRRDPDETPARGFRHPKRSVPWR